MDTESVTSEVLVDTSSSEGSSTCKNAFYELMNPKPKQKKLKRGNDENLIHSLDAEKQKQDCNIPGLQPAFVLTK